MNTAEKRFDDIMRKLVAQANAIKVELTGATPNEAMGAIKSIIANNDLVFALWPDRECERGFGSSIVKGSNTLREIFSSGNVLRIKVAAIPCMHPRQAEAVRIVLGDKIN